MLAIILFIALFLFSLWFTGFIAKALGAQRPGMLWVFLLFISMLVVQVLLGLSPLVQHPIILIALLLLIAAVLYAKILDMGYLFGFLTMLVSSIVTGLLAVGITLIVGLSLPGVKDFMAMTPPDIEGEVTLDTVATAAESVCKCETDKQCMGEKSREFGQIMGLFSMENPSPVNQTKLQRYTERALLCSLQPGAYDISKAVIKQKPKFQPTPIFEEEKPEIVEPTAQIASTDTEQITAPENLTDSTSSTTAMTEETAEVMTASISAYQAVSLTEAKKYFGRPARITRKSGGMVEGKLSSIKAGKLTIEQRRYGGTFSFPVKTGDITQLEIYY